MLHTLNLYSAVCPLSLNKTGRKKDAGGFPVTWETCCRTLTCYELKTLILRQCLSRTKPSGIRKTEFRRQLDSNISKLHDLLGLILVIC